MKSICPNYEKETDLKSIHRQMKGVCPNCEKETDLESIHTTQVIKVRGEGVEVEVDFYKCKCCGDKFDDLRSDNDPLDKAYREYRRRHGIMQPEEIRDLRNKFGLTQIEMSNLLGWGGATLSRYENGALQDEAHGKILRLIADPRNLLNLLNTNTEAVSKHKNERLIKKLRSAVEEYYPVDRILEEHLEIYEPDEFSGFKRFDIGKLWNAIHFFCQSGIYKTVLNKHLFYADFKHFKEYTVSITGVRYARIPFGPAPDNYDCYFAVLRCRGDLRIEEVEFSNGATGEKYFSKNKPDLSLFSDTEIKTLIEVKDHFKGFTAKKISKFSHDEKGFIETPIGQLISYKYAKDLQL